MENKYFYEVKVGDAVYSYIYGPGRVQNVLPKKQRIDGFFVFSANFETDELIHYTLDGIPSWCQYGKCQTLKYTKDINFDDIDFKPINDILSKKRIDKLIEKGDCQMRCPSGLWVDIDDVPNGLVKENLKNSNYHLFKKN